MMARVPAEDVGEVQADWKNASVEDKKQMVWDVRKLLDELEDDGDDNEPAAPPKPTPEPPLHGGYSDEGGKSEVRRRGGKRSDDLEYGLPICGSQPCLAEQLPICHSHVRARHYRDRFRAG